MKFTANNVRFQQVMSTAAASTNARSSLPVLAGVLIEADAERQHVTLTGTDLDTASIVSMEAEVEASGRVVIPASRLGDIADRFPSAEVSFRLKDLATLALVSGRTRMDLRGIDYKEFPKLPEVPDEPLARMLGRDISLINSRVAFAVADAKDTRPGLKSVAVFLDKGALRAVATNSRQLSELVLRLDECHGGGEMVLNPSALERAGKMFGGEETVEISRASNHVALRGDGRTFITRLVGEDYPPYKAILNGARRKVDRWMECDRNAFMSLIQRMQVVAGSVDISPVRLTLTADRVLCYTSSPDAGEAEEDMEVDRDGEGAEVYLRTDYLLGVLRRMPGPRVRIEVSGTQTDPVLILPGEAEAEGTGTTMLLTPLHPTAPQVAGWKLSRA